MMPYIAKSKPLTQHPGVLTAVSTWPSVPGPSSFPRLASRLTTCVQEASRPLRTPYRGMSGKAAGLPSTTAIDSAKTGNDNTGICHTPTSQDDEFWRKTRIWADTPASDFLSYRWGVSPVLRSSRRLLNSTC